MTSTLFLQPEDVATPVANDVAAGAVRASVHTVPAISAIVASRNGATEMILFVEDGVIVGRGCLGRPSSPRVARRRR